MKIPLHLFIYAMFAFTAIRNENYKCPTKQRKPYKIKHFDNNFWMDVPTVRRELIHVTCWPSR